MSTQAGPATFWVTPRLLVGRAPAGIVRTRPVSGVTEALAAMRDGFTAVLPAGAWTTVRSILLSLGLTQRDVLDRIHFAQHGEIL